MDSFETTDSFATQSNTSVNSKNKSSICLQSKKQMKISCYEKVDIDVLNYIINNLETFVGNLKRRGGNDYFTDEELKTYCTVIKNYSNTVNKAGKYKGYKKTEYTQRREKITSDGKSYTKHFGRLFPEGALSLCSLSRVLRHTIAGKIYFDVDISNCHPTILLNYCKKSKIKCDFLEDFVENRQVYYDLTKAYLGKSSTPKKIFVSLLNGGTFPTPDYQALFLEDGITEKQSIPPKIEMFISEIKEIINDVCLQEPEFYMLAKSLEPERMKERGYVNAKGTCINYMMTQMENDILLFMKTEFTILNWIQNDHCVLCWDGIMIPKKFDEKTLEIDVNKVSEAINQHFNFTHKIKLVAKPMEEGFEVPLDEVAVDLPECIDSLAELKSYGLYESNREEFERTNFKLQDETIYCEEISDGQIIRRKEKTLRERYRNWHYFDPKEEKISEFANQWIRDRTIRTYEKEGVYPEGCSLNIYNRWKGFQAESYPWATDYSKADVYINLVKNLCNRDEKTYNYFLKFLAQMIQKPHIKPNVCIVIKSIQGAGKDTLYNIMEDLIGQTYCFNTSNVERDIFGRFNTAIENKILVVLNECSVVKTGKKQEDFKFMITSKTDSIEEKGLGLRTPRSMCRYMVFTNSEYSINIQENDRRFLVIDCVRGKLSHLESERIYSALNNDKESINAFYQYLKQIDIEGFQFDEERPINQYQKELKEASLPLEHLFFRDYISQPDREEKMHTDVLFERFINFRLKMGYKEGCTMQAFALRISKYSREDDSGLIRSKNGNIKIRVRSVNGVYEIKESKGYSFDFEKMNKRFCDDNEEEELKIPSTPLKLLPRCNEDEDKNKPHKRLI